MPSHIEIYGILSENEALARIERERADIERKNSEAKATLKRNHLLISVIICFISILVYIITKDWDISLVFICSGMALICVTTYNSEYPPIQIPENLERDELTPCVFRLFSLPLQHYLATKGKNILDVVCAEFISKTNNDIALILEDVDNHTVSRVCLMNLNGATRTDVKKITIDLEAGCIYIPYSPGGEVV